MTKGESEAAECNVRKKLEMARTWRWEYGRRGKAEGCREVEGSDAGRDGTWYAGAETGDA